MSTITPTSFNLSPNRQNLSPEQKEASQAEQDSQRRIAEAQHNAQLAEKTEEENIDHTKDEFSRQYLAENRREEAAYAAQKQKGYEQLRDLKRAQQAELQRISREGEKQTTEIDSHYKHAIADADTRGTGELRQTESQLARQTAYEKKKGAMELDLERQSHQKILNELKEDNEAKFTVAKDGTEKEYSRLKDNYLSTTEKEQKDFNDRFTQTSNADHDTILGLENRASQQIKELRADTAEKLAAYGARQADPFYKLQQTDAQLSENADSFILTARIPQHERQHVSVTVSGNLVTLSGYRRNEEKLELSPGRKVGTNSFQSYNETFPISWPVEARLVSKEFDGDQMIVRIPKKTGVENYQLHKGAQVDRVAFERPHFPENIPYTKPDVPDAESSSTKLRDRTLG